MTVIVVSNRVARAKSDEPIAGGLAAALIPMVRDSGAIWVGSSGQTADAAGHLEAAARLSPQTDYMHYQLQAALRRLGRDADADRELEIYKGLKAKSRERLADQLKQNR